MRGIVLAGLMVLAGTGNALAQDGPPEGPPPGAWHPEGPPPGPGGPRGPLFISPMGEPFRGVPGGPPPQDAWFDGADADHDGALSEDEMVTDAARFFAMLDQGKDGEIDPDDIERYETVLAPEIRTGGFSGSPGGRRPGGGGHGGHRGRGPGGPGGGGHRPGGSGGEGSGGGETRGGAGPERAMRQGAARFGYLDYPEPVTVADRNLNRGVDTTEFSKAASMRFAMLDANGDGRIEKSELPKLRGFGGRPLRDGGKSERRDIPK